MDSKPTSERLVETMMQLFLHPEKRPPSAASGEAQPFTIAISRDCGANGHLIARAVGARLDWPVYDKELLSRIADDMGLHARLLEGLDEKQANWLQDALAGLTSAPNVDSSAYVHHLIETLFSLAANGECVILGRGAAQVLPAKTTLRVRLVGALNDRIAAIERRLNVKRGEAVRLIAQTDHDRTQFVTSNFDKDPADPCNYDLVLNSARLGDEICADLIVEALLRVRAPSAAGVWAASLGHGPHTS